MNNYLTKQEETTDVEVTKETSNGFKPQLSMSLLTKLTQGKT